MVLEELLFGAGGIGMGIISYFLKSALNELKLVKEMAIDTKQKLAVLESNYIIQVQTLNDKIDDLKETIKDLTCELKEYNKKVK